MKIAITNSSKFKTLIVCGLAIAFGGASAWVDAHNDEVQPAVLCILALTMVLGAIELQRPWRWALLTGLCIPGALTLTRTLGWRLAYPTDAATPAWALLALVPTTLGAYAGAALHRAASRLRRPFSSPPGATN